MDCPKCRKGIVILLAALLILEAQALTWDYQRARALSALLQASRGISSDGKIYYEPADPPAHIHLTWQSSDMSTTISVTWQSSNSGSGNTVKYGRSSSNYVYSKDGVTPHTYSGASGYIHDVELTGLSPDTVYYFVCGGNTGGWGSERKFRTAPAHPTHVNYVAGGDCRTNTVERDKVSSAMRVYNPSFVLLGGDLVEAGTTQSLWDGFYASMDSIWIDSNGFTIPIIPCIGNHEGNAVNYWQEFALPSPETWYSLDWGDLLHIIVLDTETSLTGTQLTWLQNDLATHQSFVWKTALFHQPPYSSGPSHGSNLDVRTNWCPLFEQYHVQIVWAGHDHDYERSKPVYHMAEAPSYSNGTLYVVSGGWGAPLETPNAGNWWTAYEGRIFNFVLVDALATGTLNCEAKNDAGTTFDQVQITTSIP